VEQYRQITLDLPTRDWDFWVTCNSTLATCPNCREQVAHRPNAYDRRTAVAAEEPGTQTREGWIHWFHCPVCHHDQIQDPVTEAQLQVWGSGLGGWMPVPDAWQEAAELGVAAAAILGLADEHGPLPLHEILKILGPYFQDDPDALSDALERHVIAADRAAHAPDEESAGHEWVLVASQDLPRRRENMPRASAIREAITLNDLVTWCEDRRFWPARGEAVPCRELAERIGASLYESVYVIRYPSSAIDVHELVVTSEGCWLPGPLHGTIEPPVPTMS
jgi:hypothetical protein